MSFLSNLFKAVPPDLSAVKRHYHHQCGLLYDGYTFKQRHNQSSLTGYQLETFTFTFPAVNDYYVLSQRDMVHVKEQLRLSSSWIIDDMKNKSQDILVWCGPMYDIVKEMLERSGASAMFRSMPTSIDEATDILFNDAFYGISIHGMPPNIIELSNFFSVGTFCSENEIGNIIMSRRFERADFAFLQCFDPQTWHWIVTVLVSHGLVLTFIGKSSMDEIKNNLMSFKRLLYSLVSVSSALAGSLLSQGMGHVFDKYRRTLVTVWLLACIVLMSCMDGSMRDLMSHAVSPIEPEEWSEIFTHSALIPLKVITSDAFPYWKDFYKKYRRLIDESGDRFIRFNFSANLMVIIDIFGQIIFALFSVEHYLVIGSKRVMMLIFWIMIEFKAFWLRMLSILRDQNLDDKQVGSTFDDLLSKVTEGMYISPGRYRHPFLSAFTPQTEPPVKDYVNNL